MSIAVQLPPQIFSKWNPAPASPHILCCDTSDSETDSVFDSDQYSCKCWGGCYSSKFKLAAIPPVVATESATGNFLAATTADTLLLELIGQDNATAKPDRAPAATTPGPAPSGHSHCMPPLAADAPKCREVRVNSDFLRQYALDYCARIGGVLPMSDDIDEIARLRQKPALKQFDAHHGLLRISALSKEKLWHSVVLEAREDARPHKAIVPSQTGKPAAEAPLALPAGVLTSARHLHHTSDWCTMSTFTQYTRKGWCSERWATVT